MAFSQKIIKAAFERQGGLCAGCGKRLVWLNSRKSGTRGRWEAHHRKAVSWCGKDTLRNCICFCLDCHLRLGHDGNFRENTILKNKEHLSFLYAGKKSD